MVFRISNQCSTQPTSLKDKTNKDFHFHPFKMCVFDIPFNALRHKCTVSKIQVHFFLCSIGKFFMYSTHVMYLQVIAPKSCAVVVLIGSFALAALFFICSDLTECMNNDYNDLFCCCCWFRWVFLLLHRNILRAVNCMSWFRESLFTVTASCAAYFVFAALKNRKLTCTRDTKMHVLER